MLGRLFPEIGLAGRQVEHRGLQALHLVGKGEGIHPRSAAQVQQVLAGGQAQFGGQARSLPPSDIAHGPVEVAALLGFLLGPGFSLLHGLAALDALLQPRPVGHHVGHVQDHVAHAPGALRVQQRGQTRGQGVCLACKLHNL